MKAVSIPVVAIGGINKDNAIKLAGTESIAVVSAIFARYITKRPIKAGSSRLVVISMKLKELF